jgi:multidrug efflux pump
VNISEPFIRRPVATSLLMAGVILLGILGYKLLPIWRCRRSIFRQSKSTYYPGASADVMVSAIPPPLERQWSRSLDWRR